MTEEKKTHYQVSFTGGQALTAVVTLLIALGLSFFLGAKAGFERSGEPESASARRETPSVPVPVPSSTSSPSLVSTSASAGTSAAPSTAPEEAPVFEDREAGVSEEQRGEAGTPAASPSSPSRTEIAGAPSSGGPSAAPKPAKPRSPSAAPPVETSPAPPKEKAAAPSAKKAAGFFVQVLSTSSKSEAARWKDRLAARSYRTAAVTAVESKKGKLYRVRIGPYPTRVLANKAAAKINADFRQKAWVASE